MHRAHVLLLLAASSGVLPSVSASSSNSPLSRSSATLSSWAGVTATVVTTNAPVLHWSSSATPAAPGFASTAIIALRVNVSASGGALGWSTGEMRTNVLASWQGLAVYEGPGLTAGARYSWTAEERIVAFSNGSTPTTAALAVVASGSFTAAASLLSARAEAAAVTSAPNMSALWSGSWHSVNDRIQPSGFLPTSVSGGYGGITQMFVRDASGQLIGLMQTGQVETAGKALRFMLSQLQAHYQPGASFLR